jgi:hypothetical protein
VEVVSVAYAANIGDELTGFFGTVLMVVVKVAVFLAIMAVGWFVARWIHGWLRGLLERVGLDRAVDRGGLRRVLGGWSASDLAAKIIQYGLLLVTLQLALGIFGPNPVSAMIADVVAWLPKLLVAVVIVVVAAAIAGAVKDLVSHALHGLSYGRTLATLAQVGILTLGLIAALNQVGIGTSVTMPILIAVLATVAGILIVGVGGGMIRPMQQRWERMLTTAEAETAAAAGKVRENRATAERARNAPGGFAQPAYGGQHPYDNPTIPTIPAAYGGLGGASTQDRQGGASTQDTQGARPAGYPQNAPTPGGHPPPMPPSVPPGV